MTVLQEIASWAATRPLWQQDALRQLIVDGRVDDEGLTRLVLLAKQDQLLLGSEVDAPIPSPITSADVAAAANTGATVQLLTLKDLHGVNAIPSSQKLEFQPTGLTIIFGYNGSGKTGYARVLRQLCRARARGGPILSDVFSRVAPSKTSAAVVATIGGTEQQLEWTQGKPSPPELSAISFFDRDCANVHVEKANEIAYTPFGLDVMPKLVGVCKRVQAQLKLDRVPIENSKPQSLQAPQAAEGTKVHALLLQLKRDTPLAEIDALANLTEAELEEIERLKHALSDDPLSKARERRRMKVRIDSLASALRLFQDTLGDKAMDALIALSEDAKAKAEAAEIAAQRAFSDQPLDGVGSSAWTQLWQAARKFAETDAYKGMPFPNVGADARCVLCQQTLDESAGARLQRFEDFVQDRTRLLAAEAQKLFSDQFNSIRHLTIRTFAFRESLEDLAALMPDLGKECRAFVVRARVRRRCILSEKHKLLDALAKVIGIPPIADLEILSVRLAEEAHALEAAAKSDNRQGLQKQLAELIARQWLGTVRLDVVFELNRLELLWRFDQAIRSTDPTAITTKSGHLTDQYVTNDLIARFEREVKALGAGRLRVRLESAGAQMGAKKLRIVLGGAETGSIEDVLSEGEFRCISLAGFLTEIQFAPGASGIILDDPVCSLDHNWQRRVALRLVEEACNRQVIVFTHDVVFLRELVERAEEANIEPKLNQLNRTHEGCGICEDGVAWIAMTTKSRLGYLRKLAQVACALSSKGDQASYG